MKHCTQLTLVAATASAAALLSFHSPFYCESFIVQSSISSTGTQRLTHSSSTMRSASSDAETTSSSNKSTRTRQKWHFGTKRQRSAVNVANSDSSLSASAIALPVPDESYTFPPFIDDSFQHSLQRTTGSSIKKIASNPEPLLVDIASTEKISDKASSKTDNIKKSKDSPSIGLMNSIVKNAFENILTSRLDKMSKGQNIGMEVQCRPDKANSPFHLARGLFVCDATLTLRRIVFPNIRFSGGQLEIKRLRLNLWRFCQLGGSLGKKLTKGGPRYLKQFDLVGHKLTMTQDDLFESSCIRNGLERLLTRILSNRGLSPTEIKVESISILPGGRISIGGVAIPSISFVDSSLPEIPFEVRTNIGTSSRGHVLTFPGMELSLTPQNGLFVPIIPEITVDLGHNAQITYIYVNPKNHEIQLSAKVTITPEHTIAHIPNHFQQSARSFAAMCAIDVGRWLTYAGRFAK